MGTLFDLEIARERRDELLHEAEERRIADALRRARRGVEESRRGVPIARGSPWAMRSARSAVDVSSGSAFTAAATKDDGSSSTPISRRRVDREEDMRRGKVAATRRPGKGGRMAASPSPALHLSC